MFKTFDSTSAAHGFVEYYYGNSLASNILSKSNKLRGINFGLSQQIQNVLRERGGKAGASPWS